KFSEYLNITHLRYAGELTVFCAAVLGAALGFLWYNCHPADVFMGDTGSLALGGALGTVAVLIKREFWLAMVGGVFVAEAAAVVVGAGRSGLAAARLLVRHGASVRIADARPAAALGDAPTALRDLGVECRFGDDTPALLEGRDFVVWSPGIPIEHPIAIAA